MRPTINRLLSASIGLGALGLAAVASVQSYAAAPPAGSGAQSAAPNVSSWVQITPATRLVSCPRVAAAGSANTPFFDFARTFVTCEVDGPYAWNGNPWYIQRLTGVAPDGHDVIRACTPAAISTNPDPPFFKGPCGTKDGAGPLGCETCRVGKV